MFCIECGQQLDEDAKFCFTCGAEITVDDDSQVDAQEIVPDSYVAPPLVQVPPVQEIPVQAQQQPEQVQPVQQAYAQPVAAPIQPAQPRVAMAPPDEANVDTERQRKIIVIVAVIAVLAVISAIVIFISGRGQNDDIISRPPSMEDEQIPEFDLEAEISLYHIERVAHGYLEDYHSATVGEAFGQFFTDYGWNHFVSGATNYVSFFGMMPRDDDYPISVQISFRFTVGDLDFNAATLHVGSYYQGATALRELLDEVFANAR